MSMIQLLMAEGQPFVIPANSGILTSGSSYTLPVTSGTQVKILAIGGGGGGGGGTARTVNTGPYTGGGGGGSGDIRYTLVNVTPGQTITFSIGGGGSAGGGRDGGYSGGSSGGSGGTTSVIVNGNTVVLSNGGGGGTVSQVNTTTPGGSAGSGGTGTQILTPQAGQSVDFADNAGGGYGATGFNINATVGVATPYSYGSQGVGGIGTDLGNGSGCNYSFTFPTTGSNYGGGGGGGGKNNEYCGSDYNYSAAAGSSGAVFIWWGY